MRLRASVYVWVSASLCLFLSLPASGEQRRVSGDSRSAPGEEGITADGLRQQLTFLASPEFEGRESGTRGGRAAARYLALQFAQVGLQPIGPSYTPLDAAAPSFYQPFDLLKYRWDAEATSLQVLRDSPAESVRTYVIGADFVPRGFPGNVEVTAQAVFAGYGITAPELDYDDYAELDVRGRIVLVFAHEPEEMIEDSRWGGLGHTREAANRVKARNAQARGAVALLVIPEPLREHQDHWTRARGWPGGSAEREHQALDESEISIPILYLRPRIGRALFAAAERDPAATQREIDSSGRSRSFSIPDLTMKVQMKTKEVKSSATANVIGFLEGSDPELKEEVVIVSAHYDHDGTRKGRTYPGADDDGSGTVSVLEIARAMSAAPERPRRSVLFAAWGAEEKGLFGSEYYATHPHVPLSKTAAMVQLDMVGRDEAPIDAEQRVRFDGRDTSNSVNLLGTSYSPEFRELVARLNQGLDLDLDYKFDRDVEQNLFGRSDQWPFAMRDVPTLFFFTGLHPDYHTPADTAIKINYAKLEKIARLAYRSVWAIANADERPKFSPIPQPAAEKDQK